LLKNAVSRLVLKPQTEQSGLHTVSWSKQTAALCCWITLSVFILR